MRFLLVVDQFVFPAFVIENDQFLGRMKFFIKEVGNDGMNLAMAYPLGIVKRVTDHPYPDAVTVFLSVVLIPVDLGEIGTV